MAGPFESDVDRPTIFHSGSIFTSISFHETTSPFSFLIIGSKGLG